MLGQHQGWWDPHPTARDTLIPGLARVQRLITKVWRGREGEEKRPWEDPERLFRLRSNPGRRLAAFSETQWEEGNAL